MVVRVAQFIVSSVGSGVAHALRLRPSFKPHCDRLLQVVGPAASAPIEVCFGDNEPKLFLDVLPRRRELPCRYGRLEREHLLRKFDPLLRVFCLLPALIEPAKLGGLPLLRGPARGLRPHRWSCESAP